MYSVIKEYVGINEYARRFVFGAGLAVGVLLSSGCTDSASKQMYVKPAVVEQKESNEKCEKETPFPGVWLNKKTTLDNLGSRVAALMNNR